LKPELVKAFGGSVEAKRAAVPYANVGNSLRRLNKAFHARMESIARTETLIASGEAMDRAWDQLAVPNSYGGPPFRIDYVQYVATQDDRTCEWCVPRHGAIYQRNSVKTPIHPRCRCALVPVTLEGLAVENLIRGEGEATWEERAAEERNRMIGKLMAAHPKARLRPMGTQGHPREGRDLPLMERTKLPWGRGADTWPAGPPVWTPAGGWEADAMRAQAGYAGAGQQAAATRQAGQASAAYREAANWLENEYELG
jgi:hypothetical protein